MTIVEALGGVGGKQTISEAIGGVSGKQTISELVKGGSIELKGFNIVYLKEFTVADFIKNSREEVEQVSENVKEYRRTMILTDFPTASGRGVDGYRQLIKVDNEISEYMTPDPFCVYYDPDAEAFAFDIIITGNSESDYTQALVELYTHVDSKIHILVLQ